VEPTATTAIYTLSLHDALPIYGRVSEAFAAGTAATVTHISRIGYDGQDYELPPVEGRDFSNKVLAYVNQLRYGKIADPFGWNFRSEEHTSELQSRENLVCRLLL